MTPKMPIPKEGYFFSKEQIEKIEELRSAKYMGYWCLRSRNGGWTEQPFDVFYQKELSDPSHSHYFALMRRDGEIFIANGESAFAEVITALLTKEGSVLVSRYRHDYVAASPGEFIDGGRDYLRWGGQGQLANFAVKDGEFVFQGFV